MKKYIPSEALKELINDVEVCSYRLVDGTYLIAEVVDHDLENNVLHVADPLQLSHNNLHSKTYLRPWLDTRPDETVQLSGDKVIGFTETPFDLKLHYHQYFLIEKLQNILTEEEIFKLLFQNDNPQVDNLDFMEDDSSEEWKVDNGIDNSSGLKEDSVMDYHMKWRKKHQGNN